MEVLLLAERLGFKVEDRPVEWINSPESKVRIISDSLHMLRDAWGIRARWSAEPPVVRAPAPASRPPAIHTPE